MKKYITPELDAIELEDIDVIQTSTLTPPEEGKETYIIESGRAILE